MFRRQTLSQIGQCQISNAEKSGTGRFGKKKFETFRQSFHAETSRIILFLFLDVGMMQSIKRSSGMSPFPLVPRGPLGPLIFPSC